MAKKYCQHGLASGLNDGTSAANAFQNLWTLLTGGYNASLAPGDWVLVAAHDGTSNITVTGATTAWSGPTGSDQDPILLLVDDGTDTYTAGTLTINTSSWITPRRNYILDGQDPANLVIFRNNGQGGLVIQGTGEIRNFTINSNQHNYRGCAVEAQGGLLRLVNPYHWMSMHPSTTQYIYEAEDNNGAAFAQLEVINPTIDFGGVAGGAADAAWNPAYHSLVRAGLRNTKTIIKGGSVVNKSTLAPEPLFALAFPSNDDRQGRIEIDGLSIDSAFEVADYSPGFASIDYASELSQFVFRGGAAQNDFFVAQPNGWAYYRSDLVFPVLSAKNSDGVGTPYSFLLDVPYVTINNPLYMKPVVKYYDQTAGAKTITIEFLIQVEVTATDANIWADIEYTNSSGARVRETTRTFPDTAANLAASSGWTGGSPPSYGSQTFNAVKITHTTEASVKQYSDIVVAIRVGLAASATNKYLGFCDPDFAVS